MSDQHPRTHLLIIVAALLTTACKPTPCDDSCAEAQDQGEDDGTPTDLPCGGADLLTDNDNCGFCGNECELSLAQTAYEAGGCEGGVCGLRWGPCQPGGDQADCNEACAQLGQQCVAGACGGFTGLVFNLSGGDFSSCTDVEPYAVLSGTCDEPIPWILNDLPPRVRCCCE